MATINLGSIKFNWKGAYAGGTAYAVDDVVSYNGSSYICILASTGNLPTNGTYFSVMSQAGTDGTDVGTTITTQGDILYRNASGLQRLGAGTSGQVLQTGGTGANPSWTTVSSDMVKLVQLDLDSNPAQTQTIDGYFSSTYTNYKIILNGVHMASGSSGTRVGWYFRRSNANLTSNNTYLLTRNQLSSGSRAAGEVQEYSWNASSLNRITSDMANGATYTISGEFYVFNALETTRYPTMIGSLTSTNASASDFYRQEFACRQNTTGALSGIQLQSTADTLNGGTITLYGLK
jgi:hypothetical protein